MKRMLCLILTLICLTALLLPAAGEESAAYKAIIHTKCNLRREPDMDSYRIVTLEEGTTVDVLEYGEDWCRSRYNGETGYLKTSWLCRFRSLDPYQFSVPGYTFQAGLARTTGGMFVFTEDYDGTLFPENALFTVQEFGEAQATIAMARGTAEVSDLFFISMPFAPWQTARENDVIYAFTTYFNDHFAKKYNAERNFNISVACERIDGITVQPGEVFSFNDLCWPYRKSNGYQYAPNISKEGYGYGGGVCQVSTTLYNCILGLPLKVTKWAVHRDRGISYAPQYFDSAVGNYSDLAFENTLPYAVTIHALPQDGVLTVYLTAGSGAAQPPVEEPLLPLTESGLERVLVCDADRGCVLLTDSPDGNTVLELPCGIHVDVVQKGEEYTRVKISSHEGYIASSAIYSPEDSWNAHTSSALLMRARPDKEADQIYRIEKGGKVNVLSEGDEWAYVNANGYIGYVLRKYLKKS